VVPKAIWHRYIHRNELPALLEIAVLFVASMKQSMRYRTGELAPDITITLSEFVTRRTLEIVLVPVPETVIFPVMEGTLAAPLPSPAILTPAVSVMFSVTESLKRIVSPALATAFAAAKVV